MNRRTRRNIATFAKIQASKPQYMLSQKTMLDVYTDAFKEIKNDAVTNTVREVVRVTPAEGSDAVGIPNVAHQSIELGTELGS